MAERRFLNDRYYRVRNVSGVELNVGIMTDAGVWVEDTFDIGEVVEWVNQHGVDMLYRYSIAGLLVIEEMNRPRWVKEGF